jgi:hypothetical protein
MVWFLGQDSGEMYDYGGIDALDGDWQKVQPLDLSDDDGIRIKATCSNQGRPLDTAFIPTRMRVDGPKRKLVDTLPTYSALLVAEQFRDAVEALEPGVHHMGAREPDRRLPLGGQTRHRRNRIPRHPIHLLISLPYIRAPLMFRGR